VYISETPECNPMKFVIFATPPSPFVGAVSSLWQCCFAEKMQAGVPMNDLYPGKPIDGPVRTAVPTLKRSRFPEGGLRFVDSIGRASIRYWRFGCQPPTADLTCCLGWNTGLVVPAAFNKRIVFCTHLGCCFIV
jgi:hypothetical protein